MPMSDQALASLPMPALQARPIMRELEDFLRKFRHRFPRQTPLIEALDGALCATQCMRRELLLKEWLPVVMGHSKQELFDDETEFKRFADLCKAKQQDTLAQLIKTFNGKKHDSAIYLEPLFLDYRRAWQDLPDKDRARLSGKMAERDLPPLGLIWAKGFDSIVKAFPLEWVAPKLNNMDKLYALSMSLIDRVLKPEEILELPVDADGDLFHEQQPRQIPAERSELLTQLTIAVTNLYALNRSRPIEPVKIDPEKKVGRNDLCPCGSGKKFKKCCALLEKDR